MPTYSRHDEMHGTRGNLDMNRFNEAWWQIAVLAGGFVFADAAVIQAQYQRRYEPNRPTVSPYLNLFRFNDGPLPNYQSLVRPEQQAQRFSQQQRLYDRQQTRTIDELQSSVTELQQPPITTELVAPTGKGSWFNVQTGSQFGNTSRYFSQSSSTGPQSSRGTAPARGAGAAASRPR